MRISKIGKDRAAFSLCLDGNTYHIFYHVSIVVTKVTTKKWYYVVPDSCRFPVSPMALSHNSVLVVDAISGIVNNKLGSSKMTKVFMSSIKRDYTARSVHESLQLYVMDVSDKADHFFRRTPCRPCSRVQEGRLQIFNSQEGRMARGTCTEDGS